MTTPQIDYASLVEKALLRVVHDVLAKVAEEGLPGRHHLYITFGTDHPGVVIDDTLRARYPTEMTIVLQHEFWGLEVEDAGFAITLKFNGMPQRLEIPFDAVTVFADPSVEFGLQFTRAAESEGEPAPAPVAALPATAKLDQPGTGRAAKTPAAATEPVALGEPGADPAGEGGNQAKDPKEDKVVTLDRFRKK
jgi:hypothetical protein